MPCSTSSTWRATERQIEEAVEILKQLQAEAEAKRLEVVEAKKDTSSIEKLREKKLDSYNKAVQKSEELIIEEFMLMANTAAARLAKESGIPLFTGYTKIRPPKR